MYHPLSVCQLIIDYVEDKNPKDKYGLTLLHRAAFDGSYEIFKLIFENVEEKCPRDSEEGYTPLHYASMYGHLEICKCIISKVEDKILAINSESAWGNDTPLKLAQRHRHQHVVEYMKSQIEQVKKSAKTASFNGEISKSSK